MLWYLKEEDEGLIIRLRLQVVGYQKKGKYMLFSARLKIWHSCVLRIARPSIVFAAEFWDVLHFSPWKFHSRIYCWRLFEEVNNGYFKIITYLCIFAHFDLIHFLLCNDREKIIPASLTSSKSAPCCFMFLQSAKSQDFVDLFIFFVLKLKCVLCVY